MWGDKHMLTNHGPHDSSNNSNFLIKRELYSFLPFVSIADYDYYTDIMKN